VILRISQFGFDVAIATKRYAVLGNVPAFGHEVSVRDVMGVKIAVTTTDHAFVIVAPEHAISEASSYLLFLRSHDRLPSTPNANGLTTTSREEQLQAQ
jgi:hypothetical protein